MTKILYKYKSIINPNGKGISDVIREDKGIGYVIETPWGKDYVLLKDVIEVLK